MAGRRTKFTKPVRDQIIAALRAGATVEMACDAAGIGKTTYYEYLKKADTHGGLYRTFREEVNKAQADGAICLLGVIRSASAKDWKAGAWILERRYGYHRDGIGSQRKQKTVEIPTDPHAILRQQAVEIKQTMEQAKASQSFQAYAALQRQFLSVVAEIRQIESELGENDEMDGLTDEQMLTEISNAIIALPPILRQRLENNLTAFSNIIPFVEKKK